MVEEFRLSRARNSARILKRDERRAQDVEQSLDQLARTMDGLFRIPVVGWRFGLDALVGLIPGVGDTATTVVSFYILAAGVRYRVPKITLLRMAINLGIDYLLGSVPFVGDLFDMFWKANQMNVELIRKRATVSNDAARGGRLSDWLFVGALMCGLLVLLVGSVVISLLLLGYLITQVKSLV